MYKCSNGSSESSFDAVKNASSEMDKKKEKDCNAVENTAGPCCLDPGPKYHPETDVEISWDMTNYFEMNENSLRIKLNSPQNENLCNKLCDSACSTSLCSMTECRMSKKMCNNHVQMLRKPSIQRKTNILNANAEYSLKRQCDHFSCSRNHCQKQSNHAAHSFRRKQTNFSYKRSTCSSMYRRARNDILTFTNCLFELQTVFNYLVVIFIMCQLSNLGMLSCVVSCQESHSSFSYKHSKYQYPPYAAPSNYYPPRRLPTNTRSDTTLRERNSLHGPNTLPLYEPAHANISHFSEDSKMFTVFNLNGWGLRWPFGSDEMERFKLLREHLRKSTYDFVLLQEVWYLSQYELVKGTMPYITDYQALNNGGCSGKFFIPLGCSGLVILSRHPIIKAEVQPFSVRGNFWNFDGEIFVGKGIGRTRVRLWNKYTVDLFTTHLVSYTNNPNRDNTWYRFLQSAQTAHAIKTSNADIKIFGGDINARPYLESDRQPYRMLRSVMVDSLIERHGETSRFDPWYATFAHPTNTYGKGAMPERIDYLMYRCSPHIKMRTYDFTLPLIMGKDASGRPMSVSDHEALHVKFIVEMRKENQVSSTGVVNKDYASRHTRRRIYYNTDRSGLSYGDRLIPKTSSTIFTQHNNSDIHSYNSDNKKQNTSSETLIGELFSGSEITYHNNVSGYRTQEKDLETKAIGSDELTRTKFDKYHQVLYLLNLTSSDTTTQNQDYESNRIKPIIDTISDDLNY